MNPAVSVIIPSYNRSEYLQLTVRSILNQTYAPAEIIVVDDGSTEDVEHTIRGIDPRVRFERQTNAGVCRARNRGVEISRSPFIAFCDNDDLWRPDKLELQMQLHQQEPALEYSFTNFATVVNDAWSLVTKFNGLPSGFFEPLLHHFGTGLVCREPLYDKILRSQPVFPSTILMSRAFFDRVGGFKDELGRNPAEDMEFTLRCLQHAPIGVVTDPVVGIRKHAANSSGDIARLTARQVDIFRHVLTHHSLSAGTRALIHAQIIDRSIASSHRAFAEERFDLVRELLGNVPLPAMPPKSRLKLVIALLPSPLAGRLARLLVGSAESWEASLAQAEFTSDPMPS